MLQNFFCKMHKRKKPRSDAAVQMHKRDNSPEFRPLLPCLRISPGCCTEAGGE